MSNIMFFLREPSRGPKSKVTPNYSKLEGDVLKAPLSGSLKTPLTGICCRVLAVVTLTFRGVSSMQHLAPERAHGPVFTLNTPPHHSSEAASGFRSTVQFSVQDQSAVSAKCRKSSVM